jgi:hypothetical protein
MNGTISKRKTRGGATTWAFVFDIGQGRMAPNYKVWLRN